MDIAWSLKLPEDGRKVVTVDRFDAYLDDHPAERQSAKYSGLFTRASRGRRAAAPTTLVHENGPPQRSTSHATPPSFVLENQSFPIDGQPDSPNFDSLLRPANTAHKVPRHLYAMSAARSLI
jgi:hypothetical protein